MTSPFATDAMAELRERLAEPTPDPASKRRGRRGGKKVQAKRVLRAALGQDIPKQKDPTPMPSPPATTPAPSRIERRYDRDRPRTPHTAYIREFRMPDGRTLLADRRGLVFCVQAKPEEFDGKPVTILVFRANVKGCPVLCPYDEIKAWWLGSAPPA